MRKKHTTPIFYQPRWGRLLGISLLIMMMLTQAVSAASIFTWDSGLERPLTMDPGTAANSIVRIEAGVENDDGKFVAKSTASGFIVSSDTSNVRVVTALSAVDLGDDTIIHVVIQNDSFEEATINNSEMSREKGFCVLTVPNSFNGKSMLPLRVPKYDAEGETLAAGDAVTALGFPAGLGSSSGFTASDVNGAAGTITKTADENGGIIETDIAYYDGAAGGPLIDKDGYAVGLIAKAKDGAKVTAIDITDIESILDSGDYPVRTKDKDQLYNELCDLCDGGEKEFKRSSGEARAQIQSTWQTAVGVLQSRPYDRNALIDATEAYKAALENAHSTTSAIIKILAALLGAVIIGLLIRLLSLISWHKKNAAGSPSAAAAKPKKNKQKKAGRREREMMAPERIEPVRSAVPLLVSFRTGAEIALTADRITFGRGDASDVMLANRKVSSQHASIQNFGGTLCLFDLGSTNGTFVNNVPVGREGVRLMPGDVIRLADEEFRFIIR